MRFKMLLICFISIIVCGCGSSKSDERINCDKRVEILNDCYVGNITNTEAIEKIENMGYNSSTEEGLYAVIATNAIISNIKTDEPTYNFKNATFLKESIDGLKSNCEKIK